ncbi:MAG: SCP2 sterol-binding domain-containing protein [Acidobacteriota bacterium]
MHEVFTQPWVDAWADEIARSQEYRQAAASWEGPLALALTDADGGVARAVRLDLWHGSCRDARALAGDDIAPALDATDYVLQADLATWRRVLAGELEPIFGLMSGKLKLTRGQLPKLLPYVTASKELVAAAGRVPSRFPHDD